MKYSGVLIVRKLLILLDVNNAVCDLNALRCYIVLQKCRSNFPALTASASAKHRVGLPHEIPEVNGERRSEICSLPSGAGSLGDHTRLCNGAVAV